MREASQAFVDQVLNMLPRSTPRREQIGIELQAHFAERITAGRPVEEIIRQLGDPADLADSYLAANPLVAPSNAERAIAKAIDLVIVVVPTSIVLALWYLGGWRPDQRELAIAGLITCGTLLFLYTILAEYQAAQTVGKRARGLHVVRETGRRISVGQALVRQLSIPLSTFLIDALFALFTDRRQRAFELLSKTRVVLASPLEG